MLIRLALSLLALLAYAFPVQAAEPDWEVAVIIFASVAAECHGVPAVTALSPDQIAVERQHAADFAALVADWTYGAYSVSLDVIERPALTHLDAIGPLDCWPTPESLDASGGWPTGYDSIIVIWPADTADGKHLSHRAGWAYGVPMRGSTYATVAATGSDPFRADTHVPSAMVHEWMHGVLGAVGAHDDIDEHPGYEHLRARLVEVSGAVPPTPSPEPIREGTLPDTAMPTP